MWSGKVMRFISSVNFIRWWWFRILRGLVVWPCEALLGGPAAWLQCACTGDMRPQPPEWWWHLLADVKNWPFYLFFFSTFLSFLLTCEAALGGACFWFTQGEDSSSPQSLSNLTLQKYRSGTIYLTNQEHCHLSKCAYSHPLVFLGTKCQKRFEHSPNLTRYEEYQS